MNIPIYRARKIDSDKYVEGDLFNKKYIILESELNKQIVDAIEHIDEVLVSQCSTECKNEHNALKNMLYKLQSNERFEHIYEIDPSTLAIHSPDMIDSQGNKIFASLSEDGRGGDKMTDDEYFGIVKYIDCEFVVEYENVTDGLFNQNFEVIGIQD